MAGNLDNANHKEGGPAEGKTTNQDGHGTQCFGIIGRLRGWAGGWQPGRFQFSDVLDVQRSNLEQAAVEIEEDKEHWEEADTEDHQGIRGLKYCKEGAQTLVVLLLEAVDHHRYETDQTGQQPGASDTNPDHWATHDSEVAERMCNSQVSVKGDQNHCEDGGSGRAGDGSHLQDTVSLGGLVLGTRQFFLNQTRNGEAHQGVRDSEV